MKTLKLAADHVLALLPFEQAFLAKHEVPSTFVGHPLADTVANTLSGQADVEDTQGQEQRAPTLCVMPGSRKSEVAAHIDLFFHTVIDCRKQSARPSRYYSSC